MRSRPRVSLAIPALFFLTCLGASAWAEGPLPAPVSFLISPDGQHLAYAVPGWSEEGGEVSRVMVCPAGGGEPRQLGSVAGRNVEVYWAGNERLLCGQQWMSSRYSVLALDGTPAPEVALPESCAPLYMRPSPDGQKVAFVGSYTRAAGAEAATKEWGLCAVQLATGAVQFLKGDFKSAPAWSPDSKLLALGAGGYTRPYPLLIFNADTGEVTKTGVDGCGCDWAPDGQRLAMTIEPAAGAGGSWRAGVPTWGGIGVWEGGTQAVTPVSAPGGHITKGGESTGLTGSYQPVWSPDGNWIAYQWGQQMWSAGASGSEDTGEIWLAHPDGTARRKLAEGMWRLVWSLDGKYLYGLGEQELVRFKMDSGESAKFASWGKLTAPAVGEAFFAGENVTPDDTGAVLSYVGDKNGDLASMGGEGETVLFRAPAGNWAVDRVSIFGGRYGTEEAPAEKFTVYVCDADFQPLQTIPCPYKLFPDRAAEQLKWYNLPVGPVPVPQRFFICVDFKAQQNMGVYVGEDTAVTQSHSFAALPGAFIHGVSKKYDWMIRVHLRPVAAP